MEMKHIGVLWCGWIFNVKATAIITKVIWCMNKDDDDEFVAGWTIFKKGTITDLTCIHASTTIMIHDYK